VRYISGPGEDAGADALLARAARPAGTTPPAASEGGGGGLNPSGLPLLKPPYGQLNAINMDTGDIVWQTPHGETPDAVRNSPVLRGLNIPRTGQAVAVGALVTRTLVIMGEGQATTPQGRARGAMLRAYDKATGKEVGAVLMSAPQSGTPMTYRFEGRQYIIVPISGGSASGEYVAYALPQAAGR